MKHLLITARRNLFPLKVILFSCISQNDLGVKTKLLQQKDAEILRLERDESLWLSKDP